MLNHVFHTDIFCTVTKIAIYSVLCILTKSLEKLLIKSSREKENVLHWLKEQITVLVHSNLWKSQ